MDYVGVLYQNWWLILLILIIVISIAYMEFIDLQEKSKGLDCQDTVIKINNQNFILSDVRSKKEFDQNHILGARLFDAKKSKINEKTILYCDDGSQSKELAKKFNVFYLEGGLKAWVQSDMPVEEKKT